MGKLSLRPVITGLLFIIVMLLGLSLIFSLILHFTSVPETSLHLILFPTTLITLLLGGLVAGYQAGEKGWYYGGITGLGFILLSWLFSFLGIEAAINLRTIILYIGFLAIAVLGGMIGVNLSPSRS